MENFHLKKLFNPQSIWPKKDFPLPGNKPAILIQTGQLFIERNSFRPAFVKDSLWKEGDTLMQNDLAETLRRIRDYGSDGFYSGITARLIVRR